MKIGIILPARNEGKENVPGEGIEPLATIRNFRVSARPETQLTFGVIDDGSTDGCCENLKGEPDVVLRRHDVSLGESASRNEGAELFKGMDAHITFDSHERMDTPHGLEMLAEAAIDTGGIVCGTTFQLNPAGRDFPRNGGLWAWRTTCGGNPKINIGLRLGWCYKREQELQPIEAPLGASYAFAPATFAKLGGWMDVQGQYGYGEQALALKAFFLGIPMFCHTKVLIRHQFRIQRPYPMSGAHYWYNYVWCNKIIFSDDVFRRIFLPVAVSALPKDPRIQELSESPEAAKQRDEFAQRKTRTDDECLKWLRITA